MIAKKLEISWQQFLDEYTDPRWPGTTSFLIRHNDGGCVFLKLSPDNQKLCLIHDFKPECCREWTSGLQRPECQDGLKRNWGLIVDSSGTVSGTQNKLEEFERFIRSL